MARLKSSVDMVRAIEPAVRFYEEPPSQGMEVETPYVDLWVSRDDWADAFDAAAPGVPHNEARDQVWDELLTILTSKVDLDERDDEDEDEEGPAVSAELVRRSIAQNRELAEAFGKAWPLLDADDLVGDLWEVPAYLRLCAPWLSPEEARSLRRVDAQAWTVADLPLLDAARHRLGDPEASRRRRRHEAAVAAERRRMDRVVEELLQLDDEEGMMAQLRQEGIRDVLVDDAALPDVDADLLAGPFAHVVVDEAQELTDAEWQMLLLALPVAQPHHRRGPRPGQARVHRDLAGTARADRAGPGRAGHPEHQLPHAGAGDGRSRAGDQGRVPGRQRAHLDPQQRPARRARIHLGPALGPRRLAHRARRGDRLRHQRRRHRRRVVRGDLDESAP